MKTAVVTTAGLGTRLLTTTKASPKTLLPLYDRSSDRNAELLLRPLIEIIFENSSISIDDDASGPLEFFNFMCFSIMTFLAP